MSTIPEARKELMKLADELIRDNVTSFGAAQRIRALVRGSLTREPAARRAPSKRGMPTWEQYEEMRLDAEQNPNDTLQEIGERHGGFNGGRASEAVNRKHWEWWPGRRRAAA